jgi:hypothetical protein
VRSGAAGGVTYRARVGRPHEVRHALEAEQPGPLPQDFIVHDPDTLNILDRHDSIVVLMMENRSFDHYFFELASAFPGRGYDQPPVHFTNPPPEGLGEPLRPCRNDTIGIGNTLIFQYPFHTLEPSHSLDHIMFQIGGGEPQRHSVQARCRASPEILPWSPTHRR